MAYFRYKAVIRIFRICLIVLSLLPVSEELGAQGLASVSGRPGSAAKAYERYDAGELPASTALRPMHMMLAQTLAKKNALMALLIAQQDSRSPAFHHWVTPEEFGRRFGADPQDIQKVTAWLESSGMKDVELSRGGNMLSFTATVPLVEKAFQLKLHRYQVQGREHYANVSQPVLPDDLRGIVATIQGLDDFVPHPPLGMARALKGAYVRGSGGAQSLGPGDLAVLYDVKPIYAEAAGGAPAAIAVIGAAAPSLDDFRAYRKLFGLPANDFQVVQVRGSAAAITPEATLETALDLEIAGGIAPLARLVYVEDGDIFAGAAYAVDHHLADVLSLSYTVCELPGPEDFAYEAIALQGAVEGMTWVNASGDSGAAGCDEAGGTSATSGLAVNLPASLPEVTAVGGTRFTSLSSNYWSSTAAGDGTTALAYVPETAWNGLPDKEPVTASGGGISKDFFKPGYQSSIEDGVLAREVPDVAFDAAEASPAYLIVTGGSLASVAGTSAATPMFAGIVAELNQYLSARGFLNKPGLGNINPVLYRLAQIAPQAFHDITSGSNKVGCVAGSVDCTGNSLGYSADVGYDMVTGLGSVDADQLAHAWRNADLGASTVALSAATASGSGSIALSAQVQADANPSPGVVAFSWTNLAYSNVPAEFARIAVNGNGTARTSVVGLPNGSNVVSAIFQGTTALLGAVSAPVTLQVDATGTPMASVALVDVQAAYPEGKYIPLAAILTGTQTTPTGAVNFYFGGALLGSAPIVAGVATTLATFLPVDGTGALTAQYAGDATYGAATSNAISVTIVDAAQTTTPVQAAAIPDFTLAVPATLTLPHGENGSFPISIAPLNGFAAAVTLTCSGAIDGYRCSVPAAVTPKTAMKVQGSLQSIALAFLPLGSMLLLPGCALRARRWLYAMAAMGVLLAAGCGVTMNKTATAGSPGVYPVTVTAVSGKLQHSAILAVTVQ